MDASDWVVVVGFCALIPVFVFLTIMARRPRFGGGGEEGMTVGQPVIVERPARFRQIIADTVSSLPGSIATRGGLGFVHRGLPGRVTLGAKETEIHVETADLLQARMEVVTNGFPMSLFLSSGEHRLEIRGSRAEYTRIFNNRAEEQVLREIGVPFDLSLSPEGMVLRLGACPQNGASLRYWMACAFRIVDLLPGIENGSRVQVSELVSRIAEDTLCQVCGSSLARGAVVRCADCRTPHHEDCWQYTRKCSTFGCTSQRSIP
jgi:hypothetical protein